MIKKKILNLFFRIFSILGRFLLIIYIGKNFSTKFLGDYGIFITTVTLSVILVGLDFYIHATREILAHKYEQQRSIIFNQLIAYCITYTLLFPPLLLLFYFNIISYDLLIWFYLLLIVEHIGSEIYRLLIALENTIFANFLFFIRNGLWAFFLIFYWIFDKTHNTDLLFIAKYWLTFGIISNTIGIIFLNNYYKGLSISLNKSWLKVGFKVASKYFLATLAYKLVEFSDRYIIDFYMGKDAVGVYTFYSQISNLLNIAIYTLVITLLYPSLIKSIYDGKENIFKKTKNTMIKEIVLLSILSIIAAVLFLNFFLELMNKSIFLEQKAVFYFLLFSNILFNLSYVYHFILAGYKKDNHILFSSILGGIADVILNIILIKNYGLIGAGISKLVSFGLIFIFKFYFTKKRLEKGFEYYNEVI